MYLIDISTNSPQYFYWKSIGTVNENLNFDIRGYGWLVVSGKLPTYPSPKPTFLPKWDANVNGELGEG